MRCDSLFSEMACLVALCVASIMPTADGAAEDYPLPPDGGIIDVTKFGAVGDGKTDDTKAILKAFEQKGRDGAKALIYFPNGTYLVGGLANPDSPWCRGAITSHPRKGRRRVLVFGQSRESTILKLRDNCPGYDNPDAPRPVLSVGAAGPMDFGHQAHNFTIDTGRGNPGAVGMTFHTSNQGAATNIRILSSDPEHIGVIGLDLRKPNPGPSLIKNVEVDGFDIGIRNFFKGFSAALEHITLRNQRVCGITSDRLPICIRGLRSRNAVPVLRLETGQAFACVLDAVCEGGLPDAVAIENLQDGGLFVRDLAATGYGEAIRSTVGRTTRRAHGPKVDEFTSHPVITCVPGSATRSLRLRVEETPEPEWGDVADWASVEKFGAVSGDKQDDSAAIQKAIDSGAGTVYLPNGFYEIHRPVHVRGKVRRILCLGSILRAGVPEEGKAAFHIDDGETPVVVIEHFAPVMGDRESEFVRHNSTRTLVIRHGVFHGYTNTVPGGKVFLEDITGQRRFFTGQKVWCRQLNPEARGVGNANLVNREGDLWIFGLKTEGERTALHTIRGRTELLGIDVYPNNGTAGAPAFLCEDGRQSLCFSLDNGWISPDAGYEELVREVRGGKAISVWRGDAPKRGGDRDREGGTFIPLYVNAEATTAAKPGTELPETGTHRGDLGRTAHFPGKGPRKYHGRKWQVRTNPRYRLNGVPVVSGGVAYFGDKAGDFHAVDAITGKLKWKISQEERTGDAGPTPAVAHGKVYLGGWGVFRALEAETGKEVWRFATDGGTWFAPAVVGRTVVFTSAEGNIYAADAHTGFEQWRFHTRSGIASGPAVEGSTAYIGLRKGLVALDVTTGKEKWAFATGGSVCYPMVSDGVVYIAAEKIWAVEAATGKELWGRRIFPSKDPRLAMADGRIYISAPRGRSGIHVLDARTGETVDEIRFDDHGKGKNRHNTAVMIGPAIADGVMYYLQYGSWTMVAVDLKTKNRLWEEPCMGLGSAPFIIDGMLYFGIRGNMVALH